MESRLVASGWHAFALQHTTSALYRMAAIRRVSRLRQTAVSGPQHDSSASAWQLVSVKRTADQNIGHPHQYWTTSGCAPEQLFDLTIELMVARGGIEPPAQLATGHHPACGSRDEPLPPPDARLEEWRNRARRPPALPRGCVEIRMAGGTARPWLEARRARLQRIACGVEYHGTRSLAACA